MNMEESRLLSTETAVYVKQAVSLIDVVRVHGKRRGDSPAFMFLKDGEIEDGVLTFAELDARARETAARLQRRLAPGDRIVLLFPSGLAFIVAFLGAIYAGVTPVPVNSPRKQQGLDKLASVVRNCDAKLLLTDLGSFDEMVRTFRRVEELAEIPLCHLGTIGADTIVADDWRAPDVDEDSVAFLQYTSGSTGNPKGVAITHGNLLANQRMISDGFGHGPQTIGVGWLPFHHDMGLVGNILNPLYLGVQCVLMSPAAFLQRPIRWLRAISRYRATTSGGPNFAYELCAQRIAADELRGLDLTSWRVAFNGAEPVRAETLDRFSEKFSLAGFSRSSFYPCYGMAEATLFVSGGISGAGPVVLDVCTDALREHRVVAMDDSTKDEAHQVLVGCGKVHAALSVRIVDPKSLRECPEEVVGEIWVEGASVARGYWNNEAATQESFAGHLAVSNDGPFLRTGDLGFLRNGQLFVTGRYKDLIIIRGRNHYPQDIEQSIARAHPGLARTAAFSVDADGDERLVIVQEIQRSFIRKLKAQEAFDAIRRTITQEHGLSVHAILLVKTGAVQVTSSGKTRRTACRSDYLENRFDPLFSWREEKSAPSEDYATKGVLRERFAEAVKTLAPEDAKAFILGSVFSLVARVARWDVQQKIALWPTFTSVFLNEFGLDSLAVVELHDCLLTDFGVDVSPQMFVEKIRVDDLVGLIYSQELLDRIVSEEASVASDEDSEEILI